MSGPWPVLQPAGYMLTKLKFVENKILRRRVLRLWDAHTAKSIEHKMGMVGWKAVDGLSPDYAPVQSQQLPPQTVVETDGG